jgi:hypothetical protein
MDRRTDGQTDRQTNLQADRQSVRNVQTDKEQRHTYIQTDGWMDGRTDG